MLIRTDYGQFKEYIQKKKKVILTADSDKTVKDSKVFHGKCLSGQIEGDPKLLPAQQTDHELFQAADSACICPLSLEFTTIYKKHTKAQRQHTLFGSTEEIALIFKPNKSVC